MGGFGIGWGMAEHDLLYTPEVADEVCRRIAEGHTLREIARTPGMPSMPTIIRWANEDREGFAERYARAREIGWEVMAEDLVEISDDATNDWMKRRKEDGSIDTVLNAEHVNRSRLRADTRKWLLSKRLPKTFGDRQVIAGDPDAPLIPADTNRAAALLAKAAKLASASDKEGTE